MIKNPNLYHAFIGYLTKKGNKLQAKKIVDDTFFELSRKFNLPLNSIVRNILRKMGSNIELKTVKKKKNTHVVPFAINQTRKNSLLVRKIMSSVHEDATKRSTAIKLTEELTGVLLSSKSNKSLLKNKLALKQAIQNKSNIHFRW